MSIRCAIVGPTGYTGYWLIDLLLRHPAAKVTYLASQREELPNIAEEFPALMGRCELACKPIDAEAIADAADVAFTGLPHKAAMRHVPDLLEAGLRVIDLSADYRLNDAELYERVYGTPHTDPENLAAAVYGLSEFYGDQVEHADLVANPGCYPTAAAMGLLPLLQKELVRPEGLIVSAASGATGAGRSPKPHLHFPEANESYFPYACGDHRHQSEVDQVLGEGAGREVASVFVPHLLPIDRGLLATNYADPIDETVTEDDLLAAVEDTYAGCRFVRIRADLPNVKDARDTNFCDICVRLTPQRRVVVFSAIDNMIKGASGQAIQNMNLMFAQEPTAGLL